jgi:hypothetical protein
MPTLELTNDQVVELVKQLPPDRKRAVLVALAAERGRDWNSMTAEERLALVDNLLADDE